MVWTPLQVETHGEGGASQRQAQVDVADVGSQVVAATSIPSHALGQSTQLKRYRWCGHLCKWRPMANMWRVTARGALRRGRRRRA